MSRAIITQSDINYWPLTAPAFTFWDKLKISKFILTQPIWTYGQYIEDYENQWKQLIGANYVIMTSSGSASNHLIALRRKCELQQSGDWPRKNKVIFPVNTWISSVTPWLHASFEPVFVDVDPLSLNVNSTHLIDAFEKDENMEIGTVFYTALLGFFGDIKRCKKFTEAHGARFLMDNCEATFSRFIHDDDSPEWLMNFVTSSTSLFYSHFTVTGQEGGLITTGYEEEADWYRMFRSHGLTRGMNDKYKNPNVNPDFDFALQGTNLRSSNLAAYCASLDLQRAYDFCVTDRGRRRVLDAFQENIDLDKFSPILSRNCDENELSIPLALPILCKTRDLRIKVETYLKIKGVQTRPVVGGCLLMHTAMKQYGDPNDFPVAMGVHEKGLYVGINKNVTAKMAENLAKELNKL